MGECDQQSGVARNNPEQRFPRGLGPSGSGATLFGLLGVGGAFRRCSMDLTAAKYRGRVRTGLSSCRPGHFLCRLTPRNGPGRGASPREPRRGPTHHRWFSRSRGSAGDLSPAIRWSPVWFSADALGSFLWNGTVGNGARHLRWRALGLWGSGLRPSNSADWSRSDARGRTLLRPNSDAMVWVSATAENWRHLVHGAGAALHNS